MSQLNTTIISEITGTNTTGNTIVNGTENRYLTLCNNTVTVCDICPKLNGIQVKIPLVLCDNCFSYEIVTSDINVCEDDNFSILVGSDIVPRVYTTQIINGYLYIIIPILPSDFDINKCITLKFNKFKLPVNKKFKTNICNNIIIEGTYISSTLSSIQDIYTIFNNFGLNITLISTYIANCQLWIGEYIKYRNQYLNAIDADTYLFPDLYNDLMANVKFWQDKIDALTNLMDILQIYKDILDGTINIEDLTSIQLIKLICGPILLAVYGFIIDEPPDETTLVFCEFNQDVVIRYTKFLTFAYMLINNISKPVGSNEDDYLTFLVGKKLINSSGKKTTLDATILQTKYAPYVLTNCTIMRQIILYASTLPPNTKFPEYGTSKVPRSYFRTTDNVVIQIFNYNYNNIPNSPFLGFFIETYLHKVIKKIQNGETLTPSDLSDIAACNTRLFNALS